MRGIACRFCDAKIDGKPSFCARCGEPTQWASAEDRTKHDLEKWRRHRDQSEVVAAARPSPRVQETLLGGRGKASENGGAATGTMAPHAIRRRSRPDARNRPTAPVGAETRERERRTRPKRPLMSRLRGRESIVSRLRRGEKPASAEPERVIDLDADNPFAYSACASCHKTDWIIRTGKAEDGAFRYWCLRCSRGFKSDVRLAHARLPFVVGGSILLILVVLTNLP